MTSRRTKYSSLFCVCCSRSYLTDVVRPCYLTLAEQYEDKSAGSHAYMVKNYDDFNETFWQRSCLGLDIVGLTQDAIRRKFNKTFVERQSWLVPMVRETIYGRYM